MKPFAAGLALTLIAASIAQAQFNVTVTYLYPPKNPNCPAHMQGTTDTQQVGGMAGVYALLWSGSTNGINLTPPGYYESWAYATAGGQQAGYAVSNTAVIHAGVWSGSAGSWTDLNPAGASTSEAYATSGTQQAGYAMIGFQSHAGIWSGSASSWVDLNPPGFTGSFAWATTGTQQAGAITDTNSGLSHAAMWSGTPASCVDLGVPSNTPSTALAAAGNQQAGWATGITGQQHAAIWSGTAASYVDLNPPGALRSVAFATTGDIQAGIAVIGTSFQNATQQAGIWLGSSNSWFSLGQGSASGIWSNNNTIYVVGQSGYYVGNCDPQAVLWTLTPTSTSPPELTVFSPTEGVPGTQVTINGSQFSGATDVSFAKGAKAQFSVVNDSEIDAVVPVGASTGPILVTTPGGTGASTTPFTVFPTITGISIASGMPGSTITLTGTGLSGTITVSFNGVTTTNFTATGDNQLTVTVPLTATSGLITVNTVSGSAQAGPFNVFGFNQVSFGQPYVEVPISNGQVTLTIHVDRSNAQALTVPILTVPSYTPNPLFSPQVRAAQEGSEFTELQANLSFGPTDTNKQITIQLNPLSRWLSTSYFEVLLLNPSAGAQLAAPQQAGVILRYPAADETHFRTGIIRGIPFEQTLGVDWVRGGYTLHSSNVLGPWDSTLISTVPPVIINLSNPVPNTTGLYQYVINPLSPTLRFSFKGSDDMPKTNLLISTPGSGATLADVFGNAELDHLPANNATVSVQTFAAVVTNTITGQRTVYQIGISWNATFTAGVTNQIPMKIEITSSCDPPLPCGCLPWSAVAGGTLNGVQTVVAAGGKIGDCTQSPIVTITGPGGISVTTSSGNQQFAPAADGTWTVTTFICGTTRTATITLP